MNQQDVYIAKNRTLPPSQDYELLRKTGMGYIESLGNKLWTNFNSPDPGITTHEILCYALTELGYRTDFDIKDLLTENTDGLIQNKTFFTAKNILTNRPVSELDYRKLVVDIIGVHNAWLIYELDEKDADGYHLPLPAEIPIYADCVNDQLVYTKTGCEVSLRGLQKFMLDLDSTDEFGDLNNGVIYHQVFEQNPDPAKDLYGTAFEIVPFYDNWKDGESFLDLLTDLATEINIGTITVSQPDVKKNRWKIDVVNLVTTTNFGFDLVLASKPSSDFAVSTSKIQAYTTVTVLAAWFDLLLKKLQNALEIVKEVKITIHENRNLCEDWLCIEPVLVKELGICVDIDLLPDADTEKVLAEMYFLIENYLNPSVSFFTLKELLDKGKTSDEIFEGPILHHGFIDTNELENTQLRQEIYTSDIINLLMDIPGVRCVKNMLLTLYDKNGNPDPVQKNQKWCLHVPKGTKVVLSHQKSKFLFFKGKIPFTITDTARLQEVEDTLKFLHAVRNRNKLKGHTDDMNIPNGNFRELADYYSIQYEFPQVYGVGAFGLPSKATPLRKAQAKQLKAYLLFYDQLLADFFQQLKNARRLISTENLTQTYFSQYLTGIKGVETDDFATEIYQNNLEDVLDLTNLTAWQRLGETQAVFEDRQQRFLDHLLARFAENFNQYTMLMFQFSSQSGSVQFVKTDSARLAKDKIKFLEDYAVTSSERGKAFDYHPLKHDASGNQVVNVIWDTDNVSGFEKRVSRLLGIENFNRRDLSCPAIVEVSAFDVTAQTCIFLVKDEDGNVLLTLLSVKKYTAEADAQTDADRMKYWFTNPQRYYCKKLADGTIVLQIIDPENGEVIAQTLETYPTWLEADRAKEKLVDLFASRCSAGEGMYLLEHILLRPRNNLYKLMRVCLGKDCTDCCDDDPYSFRATVILPFWPERFRNMYFRQYAEEIMRTEAPAHVSLKICWVSNVDMHRLEVAYRAWLDAMQLYATPLCPDSDHDEALRDANDNLLTILETLHSEYPGGRLHDCEEGESESAIVLGSSSLGTF
ncbi:hypothetical protein [Dyadobacter sp. NIV53]|uniref:hypothetical protein n=1 Tax=Dyadobacter sp. NIV53 TaxID=2861765 RepID=UPI001C86A5CA|nr:hypothetical protein [Dyadobacter sp. NIV53]